MQQQPDESNDAGDALALSAMTWASNLSARAYGVRFTVRVNDSSLLPDLQSRLPFGARLCNRSMRPSFCCSVVCEGGRWLLFLDNECQEQSLDDDNALYAFEALVRFEVARRSPRWTFVHAGVVGWRERAILIPGLSFSGKSRLVAALVRAGATYFSDEYAVLDRKGRVYPFARPLMHRTTSGARERLTVGDLGGTAGTRALPVGLVVATRYTPEAQWRPEPLTPGEGLLALLANTVRAQADSPNVLRVLAKVAGGAASVQSDRGDADQVAAALLDPAAKWQSEVGSFA
jgi:hypothetical protein